MNTSGFHLGGAGRHWPPLELFLPPLCHTKPVLFLTSLTFAHPRTRGSPPLQQFLNETLEYMYLGNRCGFISNNSSLCTCKMKHQGSLTQFFRPPPGPSIIALCEANYNTGRRLQCYPLSSHALIIMNKMNIKFFLCMPLM